MKLYLMRHGHSPSVTEAGVPRDADRPLSVDGRAAARRMADKLLREGAKPAAVLHSPFKRAAQTAAETVEVLRPQPKLVAYEPLANTLPPEQLLEKLKREFARFPEILAVGHQPQLGELAALLTHQIFELKPGGMIALELEESRAAVLWSCNPEDLPVS